jgi:LPS sulfotransferase NodH
MKIAILSAARSGSSWLCQLFNNPNNINLWEWFNPIGNRPILKDWTIENCVKELNKQISRSINSNKDLYIKISHNDYVKFKKPVNDFLDQADLLFRLTRTNSIQRYISIEKARQTEVWRKDKSLIDKNNVKIVWNFEKYQHYCKLRKKQNYWIKNHYDHKASISFTYEKIHSLPDELSKLNFIKKSVCDLGFNLYFNENIKTFYQRENNIRNLLDHFVNPKNFLLSLNHLKLY